MKTRRIPLFGLFAAFAFSFLAGSVTPASASMLSKHWTAWGLTGGSLYELFRGHRGAGVILGGGAAYAWKRAEDAKKAPPPAQHASKQTDGNANASRSN